MIVRPVSLLLILVLSILMAATRADASGPLHSAAKSGQAAAIEKLLRDGAAIDTKDAEGQTPLLIAVAGNHTDAARVLIEAGANINTVALNKDTPWMLAGALGRAEILRLMIPKRPDFSLRNRYGGNALIPACERAHIEAIKVLLTTPIDVNHINNLGWTCLLEIVILGDGGPRHQEAARLVLDAGADPNIADKDGVSPRAHALKRGQTEIARLISAKGGR